MITGMLWFDNDPKTPLAEKVIKAADYYTNKYGQVPDLCLVHPSMMPEKPVELMAIAIRPWRPILPGHLWIGVEEQGS